MIAIQGIYDGVAIKPQEAIPFSEEYDVVITFLRPKEKKNIEKDLNDITERLAIADSLFGILPSTITDKDIEDIKEERLRKYERNY
ncbi:MAG: hypothetical protein LBI28_00850 [Treponema sp.]|jgi:hypothetical protein|nr:hypothetical protein [Treponema sp.]